MSVDDPARMRYGDVILYSIYDEAAGDWLLQHAAVYIDKDIYFEKTDSSRNDAYRLVAASEVEAKMKSLFGNGLRVEFRRLKPGAKFERLMTFVPLGTNDPMWSKYFPAADLRDPRHSSRF